MKDMRTNNRLTRLERMTHNRVHPPARIRLYEYTTPDGRRVIELDLTGRGDLPPGAVESPTWGNDDNHERTPTA